MCEPQGCLIIYVYANNSATLKRKKRPTNFNNYSLLWAFLITLELWILLLSGATKTLQAHTHTGSIVVCGYDLSPPSFTPPCSRRANNQPKTFSFFLLFVYCFIASSQRKKGAQRTVGAPCPTSAQRPSDTLLPGKGAGGPTHSPPPSSPIEGRPSGLSSAVVVILPINNSFVSSGIQLEPHSLVTSGGDGWVALRGRAPAHIHTLTQCKVAPSTVGGGAEESVEF